MLDAITGWLLDLFKRVFVALWSFVQDAFILLLDLLLSAIVAVLGAIPVPAQLSAGLGSLWSALDPAIIHFLTLFGLPQALALVGAAFVFRLGRKIVTLFQW